MIMDMYYALRDTIGFIGTIIGKTAYHFAGWPLLKRSLVLSVIGLVVGGLFSFIFALPFTPVIALGLSLGLILSFLTKAIARYWLVQELKNPDRSYAERRVILRNLALHFKKDRDMMLFIVTQSGCCIEFADPILKADERMALAAVQNDGHALQHLPDHLKKNRGIILAALAQNGEAIRYLPAELKADPEFVSAALKKNSWALGHIKKSWDMNLDSDREIIQGVLKKSGSALAYVDPKSWNLSRDRECLLNGVKHSPHSMSFLKNLLEIPRDNDIILAALHADGNAIQHIASSLNIERDEEIMVTAIKRSPYSLRWIPADILKTDKAYNIILRLLPEEPRIFQESEAYLELRGGTQEQTVIRGILEKKQFLCEHVLTCLVRAGLVHQAACYIPDSLKKDPRMPALIKKYEDAAKQKSESLSTPAHNRDGEQKKSGLR